jgi:hypothetical protein
MTEMVENRPVFPFLPNALKTNQAASGGWARFSVNKTRDAMTHVGTFTSDAATASTVLGPGQP